MMLGNKFPHVRIFFLFIVINFVNYLDRGIIPGANEEFNSFIETNVGTNRPDIFIGILQSSFMIGFSLASVLFAYLAKFSSPLKLASIGMAIWCCAIIGCALSGLLTHQGAVSFLIFFRMLSGVGEASFCCVVPPLIQEKGGKKSGSWIAGFYTAIPVGFAIGFTYGSFVSAAFGWPIAYLLEGVVMIPLVLFLGQAHFKYSPLIEPSLKENELETKPIILADDLSNNSKTTKKTNLFEDCRIVISSATFTLTVLGYSAYSAVTVGLSTFGSAFLVDLGYFNTESQASAAFGTIVCLAGLVGTPFGGVLLDKFGVHSQEVGGLKSCTLVNFMLILIGTVLLLPPVFITSVLGYCLWMEIALVVLFAATPCFTVAVMLAVPSQLQALSLALTTIGIHAFGDVPSPILIGMLKDNLAPGCIHGRTAECEEEQSQMRLVMVLTLSYFWVSVFFLGLAYFSERRRVLS